MGRMLETPFFLICGKENLSAISARYTGIEFRILSQVCLIVYIRCSLMTQMMILSSHGQ